MWLKGLGRESEERPKTPFFLGWVGWRGRGGGRKTTNTSSFSLCVPCSSALFPEYVREEKDFSSDFFAPPPHA